MILKFMIFRARKLSIFLLLLFACFFCRNIDSCLADRYARKQIKKITGLDLLKNYTKLFEKTIETPLGNNGARYSVYLIQENVADQYCRNKEFQIIHPDKKDMEEWLYKYIDKSKITCTAGTDKVILYLNYNKIIMISFYD